MDCAIYRFPKEEGKEKGERERRKEKGKKERKKERIKEKGERRKGKGKGKGKGERGKGKEKGTGEREQTLEVQTAFCQDSLRAEHRRAIDLELRPNMDHGIQNSEDHFAKETRETCQEPQPCGQCDWQSPRDFALYFFLDEWGQGAPICFGGGEVAQQRVHSTDESDPRRNAHRHSIGSGLQLRHLLRSTA